jgi:outer membrane protein insertion porin family
LKLSARAFLASLLFIVSFSLAYAQEPVGDTGESSGSGIGREPAQKRTKKSAVKATSKKPVKKKAVRNVRGLRPDRTEPTGMAPGMQNDIPGLKVGKIDVKGNKKIEADAVIARLISKTGEPYSSEKVRQDVEALFKTGYFYDVKVDRVVHGSDGDLTYIVTEKPSLAEIHFSGNKEVEQDDLKEAAALKPFEFLNMNKVRESTDKLQKLYEDKGYLLARITPRIEPLVEGETVKLTFDVQENEKVKVKRITFLGNRNIGDGKLKGHMQTQEGGFFSFVSGTGAYKQDAFDHDVQLIQYMYFNEGYVQVKVDRPQVYVTPDKKGIYITIKIDEGERFKIGTVDFSGDLLFDHDDLNNSVDIKGSGWYVHETLLKDLRNLQAKYGDLGYAYANIIPRTRIRDKDREVDITFEIDKGNKVYFGRINMVGNARTRDKVIRRELAIREGELYNETRKRESIDNVKRLGYFEEVNFNSKTPAENPDLMDIDISVKERNTGTIQVGAGYSTYSQFIFNGQVNQINLFGRGQRLGVSVDLSSNTSLFNVNFTEPHFYDSDWSVGFDAYQSRRQLIEYAETKKGGALRLGHPLAPYLQGVIRYKLDTTQIDLDSVYGDSTLFPTAGQPGDPNGLTSSGTFTLEYDKRNDRFAPTKGVYSSASVEYAGLGGDKRYTKGLFTGRLYQKLFWEFVFRNNLTYGFIRPNDNGVPPYNELFLLGGANSLRGYDWYTVGKRKQSSKRFNCLTTGYGSSPPGPAGSTDPGCGYSAGTYTPDVAYPKSFVPYGGSQELFYQGEIEFPLIAEANIKGVVFFDVGLAEDDIIVDLLRKDVGFGFRWFSPIGPLRFEWGFPLDRQGDDRASTFQFAIGSPF